ncbi:MAG: CRISPR-associated endonuclease Cas2 [Methylotenera sp.]|jgi:CRISPR-associated protein Cas2|uniref:CRISPR-associated endonuclease Cas2 n=1 Tax=Methylotenera sp. TaxID=2051956 RepID=UPI000D45E95B|nr:MAG: CRISPR-associated endonuclease Cas2 [Methylotenera sp.]
MHNKQFIICYDISCNKRRNKVYQFLSQHALSAQKSVFIFKGSLYLLNQCIKELNNIINEQQGDHMLVYAINPNGIKHQSKIALKIPGVLYF